MAGNTIMNRFYQKEVRILFIFKCCFLEIYSAEFKQAISTYDISRNIENISLISINLVTKTLEFLNDKLAI